MLIDIIRSDFLGAPGLREMRDLVAPSFFVDVGPKCNFRCLYCSVEIARSFYPVDQVKKLVALGGQHGLGCGFFTGGEPSIFPNLEEVMAHGSAHGVSHWGITSNGWGLTDPRRVQELERLGMRMWQLSWDDFRPEVLDHLRGHRRVLETLMTALEALHHLRQPFVGLYMVVARQNYEILPEMVAYTARLRKSYPQVKSLHISMLKPVNEAWRNSEVLFPMDLAVPYLRRAIEISRKESLPIWVNHLPGCLIPDLPEYQYSSFEQQGKYDTAARAVLPPTVLEPRLKKHEPCLQCTKFEVCVGYWKNYATLFGEEIFAPSGDLIRDTPLPAERLGPEADEPAGARGVGVDAEADAEAIRAAAAQRTAEAEAAAAVEQFKAQANDFLQDLVRGHTPGGWTLQRSELVGQAAPFTFRVHFAGAGTTLCVCFASPSVQDDAFLRTPELLIWYEGAAIAPEAQRLLRALHARAGHFERALTERLGHQSPKA